MPKEKGIWQDQGAITLVLDLARSFERVGLPVVWASGWASLHVLCGYFEHPRRVQFEGGVAEPLQTITAILFGSKGSCLLPSYGLRAVSAPAVEGFRERHHSLHGRAKARSCQASQEKVLKSIRREVERRGFEAINHGRKK